MHSMRTKAAVAIALLAAGIPVAAWNVVARWAIAQPAVTVATAEAPAAPDNPVETRRRADFAAMQTFRPGYAF